MTDGEGQPEPGATPGPRHAMTAESDQGASTQEAPTPAQARAESGIASERNVWAEAAGLRIKMPESLAQALGYVTYSNTDNTRYEGNPREIDYAFAAAMGGKEKDGYGVALRALAILRERQDAKEERHLRREVAEARIRAAEIEREAAQARLRAAELERESKRQ